MKDYTSATPAFSETIRITETTDPAHADIINAAPKQLLENTLVNQGAICRLEKSAGTVDEYDISAAYKKGDYCMYNGILYKCMQDTTEGGEWNPEAWGATNALEEIGILKRSLSELNSKMGNHIAYAEIVYSESTKDIALNQLNNPTSVFGKKDTPYCILFYDYIGDSIFQGGTSCIYGYTYASDTHGVQVNLKYGEKARVRSRAKVNSVWSEWENL